ncbi:MAG: signal peptide peptidase SppA [Lonepinella koalarum]|nr:signal peptide peptidase SppA [Lonepinella koalarum]
MKAVKKILMFLWNSINCIRNLVMNLVFLFFVLFLAVIVGLTVNQKEQVDLVGNQGALLLNLDGYLADNRENTMNWQRLLQEAEGHHVSRQISTFDVFYVIQSAETDDKIQGIVLDLNYFEGGDLPAMEYIGKAILAFKKSGKPVIAVADNYSQSQYFLASFADEIYLNPRGNIAIQGLSAKNLYFKSLLEKLEITPHIFRVGTYKSAVEPFLRDDMSAEAKQNLQRWLGKKWENYQQVVSQNRGIPLKDVLPESARYIRDLTNLKGDSTAYAVQRKLLTQLATHLETDKKLTALFGEDKEKGFKFVDFDTYLAALPDRILARSPNKIAVVNVEGTIVDGESIEEEVGGDTVARLLRQAYDDNEVKGVVLRVNSPGGSAFASEIIRQEVDNLQQSGKPVVVSMGGMAASGGYWISSTSDYIVADKNTITGSIGIFAMFPTFEKSLKKIGVSADGVSTSKMAENNVFSALSPELSQIYQLEIEQGYDQFLSLVAKGRNISKVQADKLAQGQIWLGEEAYANGLVDELGDFDSAVNKVIELINTKLPQEQQIQAEDFAIEWIEEADDNFWGSVLKDLRKQSLVGSDVLKSAVVNWLGFPQDVQQVKVQLGLLNRFNDPKGQYLYCLNCMKVY